MGVRKGEITGRIIDREYPHQIAIPAHWCRGDDYHRIHYFCAPLSLAPRTRSMAKDDEWYLVFCFSVRDHAAQFRATFGGEWFDPESKGRGHRWQLLKNDKGRYDDARSGKTSSVAQQDDGAPRSRARYR